MTPGQRFAQAQISSSTNRGRSSHNQRSKGTHTAQLPQSGAIRTASVDAPLLGELDSGADFPYPDENLLPKLRGRRVATAVLLHHALDRLLQAVLAQAGPALIQVLADLRAVEVVQLAVQVAVDPVKHLCTRGLMRVSAAHCTSSPDTEASEL